MKFKCYFSTFAVALCPILSLYTLVGGLSIGLFLLFISLVLTYDIRSYKACNTGEREFFVSVIILSVIGLILNVSYSWFEIGTWFNNLVSASIVLLSLIFTVRYTDVNLFYRIVNALGILAAIIAIYQYALYKFTGSINFNMYIPGLTLIIDKEEAVNIYNYRPSAFFLESAHLCIFLAPLVHWTLSHKRYILTGLYILGMLVSGSTTGFLFLFIILGYWLLSQRKGFWSTIMVIAMGVGIIVYAPALLSSNLERLNTYDVGSVRLLGTLSYFQNLDAIQWIFGIGLNQLSGLLIAHGFMFDYSMNYAAAVIYMALSYGFVGLVVLIIYLYRMFKANRTNLCLWLIFVGLLCSDQILFNFNYFYIVSFILLSSKIEENYKVN